LYMRQPMVYALAESSHQFDSRVVAINRPLCPITTVFRKPGRIGELPRRPTLERLSDNLYLYNPKYVLHDDLARRIPGMQAANVHALRHSLDYLQRKLGTTESGPLVWFNYPHQGYVCDIYPKAFCVLEIYDNLADNAGCESKTVLDMEKKLRPKIDLLLTTSHKLHDKYSGGYERSFMFGNGLSRSVYEALSNTDQESYPPLQDIAHPRIGYAGMISERMNWDLITGLAARESTWQFIFAGRIADEAIVKRCEPYPNIHFTGAYNHGSVPSLLSGFDVGIMPYLDNPFFDFLNPLKFYEMAAAGLPMVSSPIEELKRYNRDVIVVCENSIDVWRGAIQSHLDNSEPEVRPSGPELAGKFIWEDMTASLLRMIQENLL